LIGTLSWGIRKLIAMLPADFLEYLRCPMDPKREATLIQPDDLHLVCSRCSLRFPIKDGFPVLVVEEAELPLGCSSLDRLPCQLAGPQ
jgi:uncharacterized protein YbaR (Trm112 family)